MSLRIRNLLRDRRSRELVDTAVRSALEREGRALDVVITHAIDLDHVEILICDEGQRRVAYFGDLRLPEAKLSEGIRTALKHGSCAD